MADSVDASDNLVMISSHAVQEISQAIEFELIRKPTLNELFEVIAFGIRSAGVDLVSDIDPSRLEYISFVLRGSQSQGVVPGDLVSIPRGDGGLFIGVFIKKNRFGNAFGFFRGRWLSRLPSVGEGLAVCGYPVYTGLSGVWDGTWRVMGNRPDLLAYFDSDPEIYHSKSLHPHNDAIGRFGAAERASGELRQLEENEAARVGLLDGSYEAALLESEVGTLLAKWDC